MAVDLNVLREKYYLEIRDIQGALIKFYQMPFMKRFILDKKFYVIDRQLKIIELKSKIDLIDELLFDSKNKMIKSL